MRFALPCERSSVAGATTSTSIVTPTVTRRTVSRTRSSCRSRTRFDVEVRHATPLWTYGAGGTRAMVPVPPPHRDSLRSRDGRRDRRGRGDVRRAGARPAPGGRSSPQPRVRDPLHRPGPSRPLPRACGGGSFATRMRSSGWRSALRRTNSSSRARSTSGPSSALVDAIDDDLPGVVGAVPEVDTFSTHGRRATR